MTPSEKKARESLLSDASYLLKSVDHQYSCACETCRQSQVERVASALSEAERRGFERAKRMIAKKAEDFDAYKRPCLDKAHDSRFCGYCEGKDAGVDDFREDLENLKYEEA